MDRDVLLENIVSTVKTAKAFDLPIVHSTINVATGRGQPTVPELADLLEDNPRSTGRAQTRGRTPTSSPPCARRDGAS
jgi:hypothetical protein